MNVGLELLTAGIVFTMIALVLVYTLVMIPYETLTTVSTNDSATPGLYGQLYVFDKNNLLELQSQLSPHQTWWDGTEFRSCDECLRPEECPRCYFPLLSTVK